ncbi:MAG TPA: 3-hydroxyacyl-CoA dehydrogenase NAD-binding domain-containing protein, partial [Flavihumibacter sp.]|nr:3-hydroxyacyl-CoA dehydrogenase NAD-binding domain-containing protein [Flavihumibacter sp.]
MLSSSTNQQPSMITPDSTPADIAVGVVGLGLMGCSICTCLLMAGHKVIAIAAIPADLDHAAHRITAHLRKSVAEGLISESPEHYLANLTITDNYACLAETGLVIECTLENIDIKKSVYHKIESVVTDETLLASNTSAIPISILQQ